MYQHTVYLLLALFHNNDKELFLYNILFHFMALHTFVFCLLKKKKLTLNGGVCMKSEKKVMQLNKMMGEETKPEL